MVAAARLLTLTLAVAGLYAGAAAAEHLIAWPRPCRATIWWSSGIGVAAVHLFGRRAVPGVMVGEWVTALAVAGWVWWAGAMTACGNGLEGWAGAWLLRRAGLRADLGRVRDVAALGLAAAVCPAGMVAFQVPAGLLAGWFAAGANGWADVLAWWASDALGVVFVVPLALAVAGRRAVRAEVAARPAEFAAALGGLAAATGLAFGTGLGHWLAGLAVAPVPFLGWVALRFGPRPTAAALGVYAGVIAVMIARRLDPFPDAGMWSTFPTLHLLLAVVAGSALVLAAAGAERAAADRRAREAARWAGLGTLAGNLAHDLNNRLTVVLGAAALARDQLPPGSPAGDLLGAAEDEVRRLADLVKNLLASAGRAAIPDPRPADLGAAAREAADGPPGVRVTVGPPAVLAAVDPALARLAIRNVVENAVEAAGAGGGGVAVEVAAADPPAGGSGDRPGGAWVRVRVTDAGPGMSAEVADRMFEPFFSTKGFGRGIGLAATAGVLRAAGGTARVTTAPGAGTTVDLYFPAARPT